VITLSNGRSIGTFTADADGNFVAPFTVPADLPPGDYVATATCDAPGTRGKVRDAQFGGATTTGGVVKQYINIRVLAAGASTGSGTSSGTSSGSGTSSSGLARTGAAFVSPGLVGTAIALIAAGGIMLVIVNRRRATA